MNSVFIGGTPNAGKSTVAKKIANKLGIKHIDLDLIREQDWDDETLRYWEAFFLEKDEKEYWQKVSFAEHWENLRKQSEVFWPVFKEAIQKEMTIGPVIFESVNLFPHLVKGVGFSGVYIIPVTEKEIYERNKIRPRWGETDELWKIESEMFYKEGLEYKKEAEEFGYKVFTDIDLAESELIKLINL